MCLENEYDIPVIEKSTRNRRPKPFSDKMEPAPLKPTKPSVALNTKKMKEDMKCKTIASRSQSVLSSLKNKSNLENFNDTSDNDEQDKAESSEKRSKLKKPLFNMKLPELRICLNREQFDSQKTLNNEVTEGEMTVSESELSDDGMSNSIRKTSNANGPEIRIFYCKILIKKMFIIIKFLVLLLITIIIKDYKKIVQLIYQLVSR